MEITTEDIINIIEEEITAVLDEKKKKKKAKTDYSKEKKSGLHGWFSRQGGKGKSKGWVDCNTCRKDKKTGRKKCKSCGRKRGQNTLHVVQLPLHAAQKVKVKNGAKRNETYNRRLVYNHIRRIRSRSR
jgi:hypothetical protein